MWRVRGWGSWFPQRQLIKVNHRHGDDNYMRRQGRGRVRWRDDAMGAVYLALLVVNVSVGCLTCRKERMLSLIASWRNLAVGRDESLEEKSGSEGSYHRNSATGLRETSQEFRGIRGFQGRSGQIGDTGWCILDSKYDLKYESDKVTIKEDFHSERNVVNFRCWNVRFTRNLLCCRIDRNLLRFAFLLPKQWMIHESLEQYLWWNSGFHLAAILAENYRGKESLAFRLPGKSLRSNSQKDIR